MYISCIDAGNSLKIGSLERRCVTGKPIYFYKLINYTQLDYSKIKRIIILDKSNESKAFSPTGICSNYNNLTSTCFQLPKPLINNPITTKAPINKPIPTKENTAHKIPKINFIKLLQVLAVVVFFALLSVILIMLIYRLIYTSKLIYTTLFLRFYFNRLKWKLDRSKRKKIQRSNAIRNSSSTSSTNLNLNLIEGSSKKRIVLPPNVIPKFNSKIGQKKAPLPRGGSIKSSISYSAGTTSIPSRNLPIGRNYSTGQLVMKSNRGNRIRYGNKSINLGADPMPMKGIKEVNNPVTFLTEI